MQYIAQQASDGEGLSAPPRYDAKPARFALNQGSRKLCSGGVGKTLFRLG